MQLRYTLASPSAGPDPDVPGGCAGRGRARPTRSGRSVAGMNQQQPGSGGATARALLDRWQADLAAWAIPEHITAAVADSPWVLPRQVFARRADRLAAAPSGPSFEREWAALDPAGTVLDVGSGAGAASLPLLARCRALTAVDTDAEMLRLLGERASRAGVAARLIQGTWPDVAAEAGLADVVTCHHVTYNVAAIGPFLAALTAAARHSVIVEMTATHPLTSLNDLWLKFHGLRPAGRPDGDGPARDPGCARHRGRARNLAAAGRSGLRQLRRAGRGDPAAALPAAGPGRGRRQRADRGGGGSRAPGRSRYLRPRSGHHLVAGHSGPGRRLVPRARLRCASQGPGRRNARGLTKARS